jgi:hypothetical protein
MALSLRRGLAKIVGLEKILRQEQATRAQLGGIATQMVGSDDLVGDLAVIEEALSQFNMITRMHRERKMRYRDYDAMDNYGDVSVALDIYSEEATQTDLIKETNLWVTGDPQVVEDVEAMVKNLRLRTMIQGFTRQLAKYGDLFLHLRFTVEGLDRILYMPPQYIQRVGPSIDLVKFYKLENQIGKVSPRQDGMLLPWECAHFRLLSFGFSTLYGRALLEPARKRWLHLKLLEDAIAIYRLNRAVERLIFYIDVGSASPSESLRIVNQYKRKFGNKRSYIDPASSTFEQQYDPHNMLENIFWPVNSATERSRIEKLTPPPDQGQLQDLDHFNEKLYVALGIPRDYLTGEISGSWNSRESLALQDVRFSRKLHRLQTGLLEGLETITRFHLAVLYGDAEKAQKADFTFHLADISKIARQQYDQILLNRVQLMTMLTDMGTQMNFNRDEWLEWVLENYFPDLPKDMIPKLLIPDQALAQANQEIADMTRPPAPAPAAPAAAKKPAAKKPTAKKANESFKRRVLNDLLRRNLNEETAPESLTEADSRYSMTLAEQDRPVVPNAWLNKLIGKHSAPRGETVVETTEAILLTED